MEKLSFKKAFKYSFNRPTGLLNILWLFVPIFGFLACTGYVFRIVKCFTEGKFEELPKLEFSSDMNLGFFMIIKSIPFVVVCGAIFYLLVFKIKNTELFALMVVPLILFGLFIGPILFINFCKKEKMSALFEFSLLKIVFDNFADYLVVFLKGFGLGAIFSAMSIVLIGTPAGAFTGNIFFADFYRRHIK